MMRRTKSATLLCALILAAACSDSGDKGADDSVAPPDSTTDSTGDTVVDTTVDDGALTNDDIDGSWVVVRYATEDNGFSGLAPGSDPAVTFRTYDLECRDDECATIDAYIGRANGEVNTDEPLEMTFDGATLTAIDEWQAKCLSVATGAYDGPQDSQGIANISLEPQFTDGVLVSFVGNYDVTMHTEASADCAAEDTSLKADMVLFRPEQSTIMELADGVYWGEGAQGFTARGISGCAADTCRLREPYATVGQAGIENVWVEGTVSLSADGSYSGAVTFTDNCVADVWVADDTTMITVEAALALLEVVGFEHPILMVYQQVTGEPAPDMAAELADRCGTSFTRTLIFAGVPSDTPGLIDFAAPALGTDV
ncbi:MAG: hypothetical protein Q7V57_17320 [Actinomycetota bacterium]|nr:hypothetical protein [Actinomycetota bacterium]